MKIVVVDGYSLNPGDLSWNPLEKLGEVEVYDRDDPNYTMERVAEAEAIFTNKVAFRKEQLEQLHNLKYIGVTATGYDIIDIQEAQERGVTVTNVPGYGTDAVAQHTFALILELSNHVGLHAESVNQGEWNQERGWCYWKKPIVELSGKTLGIVGLGKIGERVAEIAQAFGMEVLYHSRSKKEDAPATYVPLEELFKQSDFVSLHLPLTEENKEFVNTELLRKMKSGACLINTARGALIQEEDLARALQEGQIAGAGLDVLTQEPPEPSNPLLHAPHVYITSHHAWAAREARDRLLRMATENLKAYLDGNPQNVVT